MRPPDKVEIKVEKSRHRHRPGKWERYYSIEINYHLRLELSEDRRKAGMQYIAAGRVSGMMQSRDTETDAKV